MNNKRSVECGTVGSGDNVQREGGRQGVNKTHLDGGLQPRYVFVEVTSVSMETSWRRRHKQSTECGVHR